MNMLAKFNHEQQVMSSKELLELINQVRQGMGEPLLRLNTFNAKIEDELDGENYTKNVVQNFNNTESVVFDLTLEQCMLIGMRESKSVRRHVLQKLKEMESAQPKELSRMDLIQLALAAEQENQALKQHVAVLEPKAQVMDVIADTVNTYSIRDSAKTIGIQESKLIDFMLKKRWVFRENSRHRRLCAYAQRVEQKVMVNKVSQVIACVEGDKVYTQARITAFGLTRLTALVAAAGLLNK
ncbi:phage antirepressor KilAC domain-containing protein [Acinetobacter johnsonii]|uniref:Phage antirepressor KilAC domain-containing protein n=1 Tax=Acinetobacter johnsonii TaxID=40214 RepID=A0AA42IHL4_ACIJO|nr:MULTISPECIES: phage antirepressor KilAC domain-containing protein [Acinetobacter]MDH0657225.1 phage antirepressor KilAC domain-containing protein [Acinetobacter johnsonii]